MALEQPKRPAGGAFGIFFKEKRPEFQEACKGKPASAITKMAGEKWKGLTDEQKAPYGEKYKAAAAKYEEDFAAFIAAGGEKTTKQRKSKEDKKVAKDPNKPKAPAGGAYGVFMAENRAKIVASLPKDHKITDVSKAAGEEWKALSDADKAPYQAKYVAKSEAYKTAMEEYKANAKEAAKAEEETEKKHTTPEERKYLQKQALKRAKPDKAGAPAAKRGKKADATKEIEIDADVMKEVEKLSMVSQFKNLAARPDVMSSGKSQKEMLAALKNSEGLVNKAKGLLLAGA